MSTYVCRPLRNGEIRLFGLSPGNFHDRLAGKLAHYSIDVGVPSYKALSYVWGDEISGSDLRILPNASKCITSNLACALRYLRSPDSEVLLWVDALCINQADNVEKALQVARMRDVYAIASEVVAFLGDEHYNSPTDTVLVALDAGDRASVRSIPRPKLIDVADFLCRYGEDSPWYGLFSLLRRPWFSRIWVLQEALVARKFSFQCGTASLAAHNLAEVFSEIDFSDTTVSAGLISSAVSSTEPGAFKYLLSSIGFIRKLASRNLVAAHTKQKADLLELLYLYRGYKATKARDHLFALLGLANVPYSRLLGPDYESSLEAVVSRYARYFVQLGRDPIRLLYSARGISLDNRFASWIPNWTLELEDPGDGYYLPRCFLEPPRGFYSTACSTPPTMRIGKAANVLMVTGSIFSFLTVVGDDNWSWIDQEDGAFEHHTAYIRESDQFISGMSTYPTGEESEAVQIKLLVGNRAWKRGSGYAHLKDGYVEQYERLRQVLEEEDLSKRNYRLDNLWMAQAAETTNSVDWLWTNAFLEVKNVRFCRTKNGFLGLVPLATQAGDVVCIVNGSCVPFILRPSQDVRGAFQLVGKCYIHGIMEGEAMHMKELVQREISLV